MRNDLSIQIVAKWLEDNGYTRGLATFWNSNIITELSDGKIEMWTVQDGGERFDTLYEWLQYSDHVDEWPQGEFFILVSIDEYDTFFSPVPPYSAHIVYDDDEYRVLRFADWDDYKGLQGCITVHYLFENSKQLNYKSCTKRRIEYCQKQRYSVKNIDPQRIHVV